ncbi:phosphatase PAP2 family protein [Paenibacillus sp. J2TS4]|uniref:phosphatase PAP2 family protein n=1 Tax=Paenibacillus sp. J2TS4 TaxID=2807194 RepID=UPI001AFF02E9|nr:phosphatase PAP2 family protein [Paenibacillus sp. J2TS4]GIP31493.1 phosphatase PAP2 family protein [Paenibacillus sp. J2TS4]
MANWIGRLKENEIRLLYYINRRMKSRWMDRVMGGITHLGGAVFNVVLLLALPVHPAFGWDGIVALTMSHLAVQAIKRSFSRTRPYVTLPQLHAPTKLLADFSFPSGHTTAIFSAVTSISLSVPALAPLLYFVAFLVGWSRMYLGYHYPSDVMIGAITGTGFAVAVHYMVNHVIG